MVVTRTTVVGNSALTYGHLVGFADPGLQTRTTHLRAAAKANLGT